MSFVPFVMERWQSLHEHVVELNLSESGVDPLTLLELLTLAGQDASELLETPLEYIQSNGAVTLRERIAAMFPGATVDDVLVTSGSAEANFLATWEFCSAGHGLVFMEPNYFQVQGTAANLGATVRPWWLESGNWDADLDLLATLVDDRTSAIVVTNPSNPTGRAFGEDFVEGVVEIARRHGCWILADEVYRGAEFGTRLTPTFWGRYDRVVVTGGLSKAYGLPGLRVGWAVTAAEQAARLWGRKDYTTISCSALSERLATLALRPDVRKALLARTRSILLRNWALMEEWLLQRQDLLRWRAPDAGAIVFPEFREPADTELLAERLRTEQSCLIVPGTQFRLPQHLRLGIGPSTARFRDGLTRLGRLVGTVAENAG